MKGPSDVICIIIQPASLKLKSKELAEITRAVASINKTLLPPLRIAWSRVGILDNGQAIPYTKKGMIFRKKLEEVFGDFLTCLLKKNDDNEADASDPDNAALLSSNIKQDEKAAPIPSTSVSNEEVAFEQDVESAPFTQSPEKGEVNTQWTTAGVKSSIMKTVASVLGLDSEVVRVNPNVSFAEVTFSNMKYNDYLIIDHGIQMGMDSNMAVRIVNQLNGIFGLQFPLNACHNLVDFAKLSEATLAELGLHQVSKVMLSESKGPSFQTTDEVVIVGQAVRLPGEINTPESFWNALMAKRKDIMVPVPADRWDHSSFYRPPSSTSPPKICDIIFEKAGFVNVTDFDNSFFGISTPEALYISPSTRLTLETVFEAFENACIPVSKLKGTNMGVFVAANLDEGYTQILFQDKGFGGMILSISLFIAESKIESGVVSQLTAGTLVLV